MSKVGIARGLDARVNALIEKGLKGRKNLGYFRAAYYYENVNSMRMSVLKDYPYDFRTMLEMLASVLMPIAVFILNNVLKK